MENSIILDAVIEIKQLIESAITEGGVTAKNNLIRTQKPICVLHDAAKMAFAVEGVNRERIRPLIGEHRGEQTLIGFFKSKAQDICFLPNNVSRHRELLNVDGYLKGTIDEYGQELTERILTVNVRSQLSSTAKNFDTLYERTFAEPYNLHLRCEKMVLGEFYMIPVYEYDDTAAISYNVSFKARRNVAQYIQKYIYAFNALNNRRVLFGEEHKYERVCLLIVDFSKQTPVIYHTNEQLIEDGLLPTNTSASIDEMNFPSFAKTLLDVYQQRFGASRFI